MLPVPDPVFIRDEIARAAGRLRDARDDIGTDTADAQLADPSGLIDALTDVLDRLALRERACDSDAPARSGPTLGDLGDHGINLLARLADLARGLKLPQQAEALERLTLPLACCVARAGGELSFIGPVVNAAAGLANTVRSPREMIELYRMTDALTRGISPRVSEAAPTSEAGRTWRVLIVNRAIMATRTHQPALMEAAFDGLLEHFPGDAPAFFREGLEQMQALDYPASVRLVMQRYFDAWGSERRLH